MKRVVRFTYLAGEMLLRILTLVVALPLCVYGLAFAVGAPVFAIYVAFHFVSGVFAGSPVPANPVLADKVRVTPTPTAIAEVKSLPEESEEVNGEVEDDIKVDSSRINRWMDLLADGESGGCEEGESKRSCRDWMSARTVHFSTASGGCSGAFISASADYVEFFTAKHCIPDDIGSIELSKDDSEYFCEGGDKSVQESFTKVITSRYRDVARVGIRCNVKSIVQRSSQSFYVRSQIGLGCVQGEALTIAHKRDGVEGTRDVYCATGDGKRGMVWGLILPGMSGSGVYDTSGVLVGIAVSQTRGKLNGHFEPVFLDKTTNEIKF